MNPTLKLYLKFASLFAGIFILTFMLVNFSALADKSRYFWETRIRHQAYAGRTVPKTPTPSSLATQAFDPAASATLVIPKIGVEAPIIWNVPEEQINNKLLEGVVHSQGTALPKAKGNIFITGHSSYYSWSSSPYKDVFALLDQLSPDDQIYIKYPNKTFIYTVQSSKVVNPQALQAMDQSLDQLTLMTCVPIGTNLKRLLVISTLST